MKRFSLWAALWLITCFSSWAQTDAKPEGGLKVNLGVGASITGSTAHLYSHDYKNLLCTGDDEFWVGCANWHFEFIADFLPQSERVSFGTGLRFTGQAATSSWHSGDMYWLVNEERNLRDYVTIEALSQRNYYMGVPLFFRVFFNSQERILRPYLKIDASMDFLLVHCNEMEIKDLHMQALYEEQLEEDMGEPDRFHVSSSAAVGLRIKCNNFYVCPELVLPRIEMGGNPFTFFDKNEYVCSAGIKVSFLFPVGKETKKDVAEVSTSYSSDIQQEKVMPSEDF